LQLILAEKAKKETPKQELGPTQTARRLVRAAWGMVLYEKGLPAHHQFCLIFAPGGNIG